MLGKANTALSALMSVGYGARGAVYVLVGLITIYAAVAGGRVRGSSGAFETLARAGYGRVVLALIGVGILAYVLWRFVDGVLDLENEGDDASGYLARAGQLLSGATHGALAVSALAIAAGVGQGGPGGTQDLAARLMAQPFGRYLVGAAGLVTLAVAVYLFHKAWTAAYRKQIRAAPEMRRLEPLLRFGLAAHGGVLLIIGGLLVYAAVVTDPSEAAGLGEALRILESQRFGQILLALAGVGMIGFAVYCFVRARYGIPPRLARSDVPTIASENA